MYTVDELMEHLQTLPGDACVKIEVDGRRADLISIITTRDGHDDTVVLTDEP